MWVHTQIDVELSREIAKRAGAKPRQSWFNAWRALALLPVGAMYVEGWLVAGLLPVEYGWCEYPAGIVVDPTMALSQDWPVAAYFPVNVTTYGGL